MNILFWNIHGNAIADLAAECALEHDADVVCLAEHKKVDPVQFCKKLGDGYMWVNDKAGCDVIRLFVRDPLTVLDLFEKDRYVICILSCEGESYVLASTHLPDRRNYPLPERRLHILRDLVGEVRASEAEYKCDRSIVVGDFNANPFDSELTSFDSLNATMFRSVVRRLPIRKIGDGEYPVMYNPVLRALDERTESYGSYYIVDGIPPIYWHCLDQVVVSRSLIDRIDDVRYVRKVMDESLVGKAGPIKYVSDHLPLVVTIGRTA